MSNTLCIALKKKNVWLEFLGRFCQNLDVKETSYFRNADVFSQNLDVIYIDVRLLRALLFNFNFEYILLGQACPHFQVYAVLSRKFLCPRLVVSAPVSSRLIYFLIRYSSLNVKCAVSEKSLFVSYPKPVLEDCIE